MCLLKIIYFQYFLYKKDGVTFKIYIIRLDSSVEPLLMLVCVTFRTRSAQRHAGDRGLRVHPVQSLQAQGHPAGKP